MKLKPRFKQLTAQCALLHTSLIRFGALRHPSRTHQDVRERVGVIGMSVILNCTIKLMLLSSLVCGGAYAQSYAALDDWPLPSVAIDQLPKIEPQGMTEDDLFNARLRSKQAYYLATGEAVNVEQLRLNMKNACRTQFWKQKPTNSETPFMVTLGGSSQGFIKLNNTLLNVSGHSGAMKLATYQEVMSGKLPLQTYPIEPIVTKAIAREHRNNIYLDLKKTSQSICGWGCRSYTAEAYLFWQKHIITNANSINEKHVQIDGQRQNLKSVYIEDRCHDERFNNRIFTNKAPVSILEKVLGFFFSKG